MNDFIFPINLKQDKERLAYVISTMRSSGKTYREISEILSLSLSKVYRYSKTLAAQPTTNTTGPHISLVLPEDISSAAPIEVEPAKPQPISSSLWYPPKTFDWALIAPNNPLDRTNRYIGYVHDWYFRNITSKEPQNFLGFWFRIEMAGQKIEQDTFVEIEEKYNKICKEAVQSKTLFFNREFGERNIFNELRIPVFFREPLSLLIKYYKITEKEYAFYENYFDVDKWEDGAPWPPLRADKIKEL